MTNQQKDITHGLIGAALILIGFYIFTRRKTPAPVVTEDIPHEEVPPTPVPPPVASTPTPPATPAPPVTASPVPVPVASGPSNLQSLEDLIHGTINKTTSADGWSSTYASGLITYLDGSTLKGGVFSDKNGNVIAYNVTGYAKNGTVSLSNGMTMVRTKGGTWIVKNAAGKPIFDYVIKVDGSGNIYLNNGRGTLTDPLYLSPNGDGSYNANWHGAQDKNIGSIVALQTTFADGSTIDRYGNFLPKTGYKGYYLWDGDYSGYPNADVKSTNGIVSAPGVPPFNPTIAVAENYPTAPPASQMIVQTYDPINNTWG